MNGARSRLAVAGARSCSRTSGRRWPRFGRAVRPAGGRPRPRCGIVTKAIEIARRVQSEHAWPREWLRRMSTRIPCCSARRDCVEPHPHAHRPGMRVAQRPPRRPAVLASQRSAAGAVRDLGLTVCCCSWSRSVSRRWSAPRWCCRRCWRRCRVALSLLRHAPLLLFLGGPRVFRRWRSPIPTPRWSAARSRFPAGGSVC